MSAQAQSLVFKDLGPQCCTGGSTDAPPTASKCDLQDGEPVGANSGNFTTSREDLTIPGKMPFGISPSYNSDNPYFGHLGVGWSSILSVHLFHWPDSTWSLRDPYGRREDFQITGYPKSKRFYGDTLRLSGNTASLRVDEKTTWIFDRRDGTLQEVHNDAGFGYQLSYDASTASGTLTHPLTGRLQYPIRGVSDNAIPRGFRTTIAQDFRVKTLSDKLHPERTLTLSYDTSGMVTTATDFSGRSVQYSYDRTGNLIQVMGVDSSLQRYRFTDPHGLHRVTSFDPLPLGVSDTVDTTRVLHNTWDGIGRVALQSSATQTYQFDRNPYSTNCVDPASHGSSWQQTCTYVRSTTVSRTDANGLGGTVATTRTYVDTVQNLVPMSNTYGGQTVPPYQYADAQFQARWITLTETVNGDAIVLKLLFDDQNNVVHVYRPDGTRLDLSPTNTSSDPGDVMISLGPVVSVVFQEPANGHGPERMDADIYSGLWNTRYDSTLAFQHGSPFTLRTGIVRASNGDVTGSSLQYGSDTAITRTSFDALGRVDSVFGYQGFQAKAWYAASTSVQPDSLTYANGTGVRLTNDALGRVTALRDALGRTSQFRYTAKGDVKLACGPDSLCTRQTWSNGVVIRTETGVRLLPDGTYTTPLGVYEYTLNAQKRRTATWRGTGASRVLIQKQILDAWGNVWQTLTNPDTANSDSTKWIITESNAYDARGRRTSHTVLVNGQNQTTTYHWDKVGHLTSVHGPRGDSTHVVMDAYGNIIQGQDPLGRIYSDSVNERGLPLMETDPLGRKTYHDWNNLGNETRRIGWRHDTTLWIWKADRLLKSRSPEGRWTTFGYDTLGHLLRATAKVGDSALAADANDLSTAWTYDQAGNRVSETLAGRRTHGWLVDGTGRILADTNALNQVTRYLYDNLGEVTSVISPAGDTLTVGYDSRGAVTLGRVGQDTLMQARSNNLGLPVWMRRPGQGAVSSQFTAMGYLQSVQDSAGKNFSFSQDAFGSDSVVGGSAGNRQSVRDGAGRLLNVLDENSQATVYAWDSVDRLKSVTTPSGLVTSYAYADSSNGWQIRTTSRTSGTTKSETHVWDRDGLLRRFTDGRGISAIYSYDSLARMTAIAYTNPDGTTAGPAKVFRYTPEGWTRAMVYGTVTDSFAFDGLGRTVKTWQTIGANTYTTEHRFDDVHRLDTLLTPDGIKIWRRLDARGRTVALWRNGVRLDTLTWKGTNRVSRTLGNGLTATYAYDPDGRLADLRYLKGTAVVTGYQFGYTPGGKLAWQNRLHAPNQSEVYTWTTEGQLAEVARGTLNSGHGLATVTWVQDYASEPSGNWPNVTTNTVSVQNRSYNGFGELANAGAAALTWDAGGNLTNDGTQNLTWTPDGRLDSVGGKVKLIYDAMGRLVRRQAVGGASVDMVWDGWREVYSSSSTGATVTRVWGNYTDEEVSEIQKVGSTETVQYPLAGNGWNIEALTDASGNITRGYVVDPFGTFTVYTSAGTDGKWWTTDDVVGDPTALDGERIFQGLPWYGPTGLYYMRNRWFSPSQARFVSIDPLGFQAGDPNLYRFEGNDPLGNLDPMGTLTWRQVGTTAAWGVGVGVVGVVAASASPVIAATLTVAAIMGIAEAGLEAAKAGIEYNTGKDLLTGRTLCPNEIKARQDQLVLTGVALASGFGAGRLAASLYASLTTGSGMSGDQGSAVDPVQADAGIEPRATPAPDPTPGTEPVPSTPAPSANAPDFIVSPGGTAFPVPEGATGPVPVINNAGNQTGVAFTNGAGGTNGQVATMRIMDPTAARGSSPGYPTGYIKYENIASPKPQGVDPYTGGTLPNTQSHFPIP
jgi:RHS repeat-associated protein